MSALPAPNANNEMKSPMVAAVTLSVRMATRFFASKGTGDSKDAGRDSAGLAAFSSLSISVPVFGLGQVRAEADSPPDRVARYRWIAATRYCSDRKKVQPRKNVHMERLANKTIGLSEQRRMLCGATYKSGF